MISGRRSEAIWTKIGKTEIWASRKQKLLGVFIENDLNFDSFEMTLCEKGRKIKCFEKTIKFSKLNAKNDLNGHVFF